MPPGVPGGAGSVALEPPSVRPPLFVNGRKDVRELGSRISWLARGGGSTTARARATARTRIVEPTRAGTGRRPRPPALERQEQPRAMTEAASQMATNSTNPPDIACAAATV